MACSSLAELVADLKALQVDLSGPSPDFSASLKPPDDMIDRWAETAALAEPQTRALAIWAIRQAALAADIVPCSVQELYLARAAGKWSGRTVPAMNLRGWTYHTCRSVFRAARELDAQALHLRASGWRMAVRSAASGRIYGRRAGGGAQGRPSRPGVPAGGP